MKALVLIVCAIALAAFAGYAATGTQQLCAGAAAAASLLMATAGRRTA